MAHPYVRLVVAQVAAGPGAGARAVVYYLTGLAGAGFAHPSDLADESPVGVAHLAGSDYPQRRRADPLRSATCVGAI